MCEPGRCEGACPAPAGGAPTLGAGSAGAVGAPAAGTRRAQGVAACCRAVFFERGGVRYRALRWEVSVDGCRTAGAEAGGAAEAPGAGAAGTPDAPSAGAVVPSAHSVVLLHGFSQSAHTWDEVAPRLAAAGGGRVVWAPEFVGHGGSERPGDARAYAFDELVTTLAVFIDEVALLQGRCRAEGGRVALVGYSMGGRVALAYAQAHPERLATLVLESAGLGLTGDAARAEAAERDATLAARLRVEGLARFMDFWETRPVFSSQRALPAAMRNRLRAARMDNDPEALARTFEGSGAHAMPGLSAVPTRLPCPVLYLAGALDAKYAAIARGLGAAAAGTPEASEASRLGGARANLEVRVLPGVGHDVHFEDPAAFCREVAAHLDAVTLG